MKFGRDHGPADPEVEAARASARQRRKIIFALVVVVLLVVGYFVGAAFLPRWWARQVGGWVHDSFTRGLLFGLAFGLIFTLIPLVVAGLAFVRRSNRVTSKLTTQGRAAILVVAVLLATPNLLTLGISTGSGAGAHAGSRILDDRAPFFQGASVIGAVAAVVIYLLAIWQYRAGRKVRTAKRSAKARRKAESELAADSAGHDSAGHGSSGRGTTLPDSPPAPPASTQGTP